MITCNGVLPGRKNEGEFRGSENVLNLDLGRNAVSTYLKFISSCILKVYELYCMLVRPY